MPGLIAATKLHACALAHVHAGSFPRGEAWGEAAMALQLELPGVFGFIAPAGGMVLARAVADEAEILTLAVLPETRRSGLARALMTAALAQAAAAGAEAMLLEVSERNLPARGLYAGLGFQEVGRRKGYYRNGSDALLLRLCCSAP